MPISTPRRQKRQILNRTLRHQPCLRRGALIAVTISLAVGFAWVLPRFGRADELAKKQAVENGPDVFAERAELEREYAEQLEQLASRCDQLKAFEQAALTRKWRIPRDPKRLYLFLPSQDAPRTPLDENDQSVPVAWERHFVKLRNQHADRLVQLAAKAIESDHADQAYQWLHEALHENPDQATARAALGYRLVNGRWREAASKPRISTIRIANPRLKFIARKHWRVESEHFSLLTDHSQKEGLKAVQQLEIVYALWRQAFYRYWGAPGRLQQQMNSKAAPRRAIRKFSVVLFGNRQKYVQILGPNQPLIAKTVGIYLDKRRTAYFYVGDDTTATRYHEAAHQFFSEAAGSTASVGERHNFWVVEAIALYMESLKTFNGYYTLGGLDANRTQYARYRAYNEHFYMPLGELCGYSREGLQTHDEIRRLYSQSAGLAGYFMNRAPPAKRKAFLEYVSDVYQGRANADSLGDKLDVKLAAALTSIDREYLLSLMVTDKDIAAWPHFEHQNLSLGHTQLSNQGLVELGAQPKLTWLDLSTVPITDASGTALKRFNALEQLNLEKTKISNAILADLASLKQLVDLDLSGTAVNGKGLEHLAKLSNLKILWLSGTDVDDEAILALKPLKQLQRVHVDGTSVTAAGLKRLKAFLPQLQE